jgi:hypothetical protein
MIPTTGRRRYRSRLARDSRPPATVSGWLIEIVAIALSPQRGFGGPMLETDVFVRMVQRVRPDPDNWG